MNIKRFYKVNNGFDKNYICEAVLLENEEDNLWKYWDEQNEKWSYCFDVRLCTGLKDINGEIVFEGDVLHDFVYDVEYKVFLEEVGSMFLFGNPKIGFIDYYELEETVDLSNLILKK